MHRSIALALLGLSVTGVACNVHEPRPVFRSGILIGDRGISVPLPPPSFHDAPQQDVEIEGEVTGEELAPAGTKVHVLEHVGGAEATVEIASDSQAFVTGLFVDLTDNCFELWLETPDGRTSDQPAFFHAVITDDEEIEAVQGCD